MVTRLRVIGLVLAFAAISSAVQAQAPAHADTMTNRSVIDLVAAKVPNSLIVQMIKSSPALFDVTATGLVSLVAANVPKDYIKLMMDMPQGAATPRPAPTSVAPISDPTTSAAAPATPTPPPASKPPPPPPPVRAPKAPLAVLPTEPGIHLRARGAALAVLEPTSYSASKMSQSLLCIGNCLKIKAVISSPEASIRTSDASAEFYFVFEHTTGNLGNSGQAWGASLTSPNEFLLLRLDKKATRREVTTGSFGLYGNQSGTDDKAVVPFTFMRIKPGVYRVIPKEPLKPGEYGFFPASASGQGTAGSARLFDFGVDGL